jgi:hypothetical protein
MLGISNNGNAETLPAYVPSYNNDKFHATSNRHVSEWAGARPFFNGRFGD